MGVSLTGCTEATGRWSLEPTAWYALMYAALLSSVLCSGIITWANKRTAPTYVTSFYPLQVRGVANATCLTVSVRLSVCVCEY
jgi:hypothetical protein